MRSPARFPRLAAGIVLTTALLLPAARAHAGNDESILIGGQAVMTAGAVQATVSDGSAAYYNPAGLANDTGDTVDINASMYGFALTEVNGVLVLPDGTSLDSDVLDWQLVPSALSYVRQLSDGVRVSFSVFIPQSSDFVLRSAATSSNGSQWALTVQEVSNLYNFTVAMGFEVTPKLRLGFSVVGMYESSYFAMQIGAGTTGPDVSALHYSEISSVADYGLQLAFGAQWDATDRLTFGATLVSPMLRGFTHAANTNITTTAGPTLGEDSTVYADLDGVDGEWDFISPMELRLGFGYRFDHGQVAVDGDLDTPVRNADPSYDRNWSGNVRAGGFYDLNDSFALGGGLFTDLGAQTTSRRDYLGASFGVRFTSRYELKDGRVMTFSTVLGGRYAYGWGELEGMTIALDPTGEPTFGTSAGAFRAHELAANLGSALNY